MLAERLQRALMASDRAAIVECIEGLVAQRAPMGGQWSQLARIAAEHGELTLSRRAMDLFVEASNGSPAARYQQAGLLAQAGALREAHEVLRALPEDVPDPGINAYSRGAAALALGDLGHAREMLVRATRLRPDLGQLWLPLGTLVNFADEPELAERILAAGQNMRQAPVPVRAPYCYALGKAYDDLGEHALAFAAFAEGGRLKKSERAYDRARDRTDAADAVRGYDEDSIAEIAARQREPTDRPIFVTGLPRSGTSLVQQVLTSHSAVSDGGEINRLTPLAREIGGTSHAALARHVAAHGTGTAARLFRHWLDERFPAPGRVVDKSMETSRFLGLAAALLPEAPLVWLRRDPLDCAWSCYRTHFLAGVFWSYDLEDIAFHFRLEDQLLAQWQDILGDRLLVLEYDSLIDNPGAAIGRILDHCGLAPEPQAFAPHENRGPVMTSSATQVREPINRKGIGSARPYHAFLEPFRNAYRG